MKRPRRNHSAAFKAKVALTAIKGEHTRRHVAHRIYPYQLRSLRAGIGSYLSFHNQGRPHTEHGGDTPENMYFSSTNLKRAA